MNSYEYNLYSVKCYYIMHSNSNQLYIWGSNYISHKGQALNIQLKKRWLINLPDWLLHRN